MPVEGRGDGAAGVGGPAELLWLDGDEHGEGGGGRAAPGGVFVTADAHGGRLEAARHLGEVAGDGGGRAGVAEFRWRGDGDRHGGPPGTSG
jgi:hypothetical protein